MPGWINVPVRIETRNRLDAVKHDTQSYDKIINELLDKIEDITHKEVADKPNTTLDK